MLRLLLLLLLLESRLLSPASSRDGGVALRLRRRLRLCRSFRCLHGVCGSGRNLLRLLLLLLRWLLLLLLRLLRRRFLVVLLLLLRHLLHVAAYIGTVRKAVSWLLR